MSIRNSLAPSKPSYPVLFALIFILVFYVIFTQIVAVHNIKNDSTWFAIWQQQVRHWGINSAYAYADKISAYPLMRPLNYPPFYVYLLKYLPLPAALTGFILSLLFFGLIYKKTGLQSVLVLLSMPVTVFNIMIVGQIDYFEIFLIIAAVIAFDRDKYCTSGVLSALSLVTKEEALIFVPVFLLMALRRRDYLFAFLATAGLAFLPLAAHLPVVLKVSYLNNVGLYRYMTMNGPNLWSLFIFNLKQPDTVFIRYTGYLLSLAWAAFIFWQNRRSTGFLSICYQMAVGFLFWPTQSQMRYEVYPFAFAFYLLKVEKRNDYAFPAYFFGITGGVLLAMYALGIQPAIILIYIKVCALVTLGLVCRIVMKTAKKPIPGNYSSEGGDLNVELAERSLHPGLHPRFELPDR